MTSYTGTCLCGKVAVSISGGIGSIIHCHCSKCRKSSGTAFATNGFVSSNGFTILCGAENLRAYEAAPGRARHFCGNCGSPVYSSNQADPSRICLATKRTSLGGIQHENRFASVIYGKCQHRARSSRGPRVLGCWKLTCWPVETQLSSSRASTAPNGIPPNVQAGYTIGLRDSLA